MMNWDSPEESADVGTALVEGAFISEENLAEARELASQSRAKLTDILVRQKMIEPEALAVVLSLKYGVPVVDLAETDVQPEAIALIPEQLAREYKVLAFAVEGDALKVAIEDPRDYRTLNSLAALTRKKIDPAIPVGISVEEAINSNYRLTGRIEEQISQIAGLNLDAEVAEGLAVDAARQSPVVQAVEMLLTQAVRDRASDVHIEPQEDHLLIRLRIDGVLQDAVRLPRGVHTAIMTRVKVLANLNIAERRRPQDGQFRATIGNRDINFRVATTETAYGEMAVLRVLDKFAVVMKLPNLGMAPYILQPFNTLLKAPFGMILVNGPTGSGKTTTLYAALQELDARHTNIMTIEDPIEYSFKSIQQIQVNRQAGITFAVGLRAIMRLDPDIILVGEIRDAETATTAVQAAITGHLVLSSIHANDAVSALIRLIDMGVEPFLVTSAVIGSLSQRLVRRVCPYCRHPAEVPAPEAVAYEKEMGEAKSKFLVGRGCNFCSHSGFMGRVGVYELATLTDEFRKLIMKGTSASELKEHAVREGMVAMRRDGMQKVRDGVTTPGEIMRHAFTLL